MSLKIKTLDKRIPEIIIKMRSAGNTGAEIVSALEKAGISGPRGAGWQPWHISVLAKQLGCEMAPRVHKKKRRHLSSRTISLAPVQVKPDYDILAVMTEVLNSSLSSTTKTCVLRSLFTS